MKAKHFAALEVFTAILECNKPIAMLYAMMPMPSCAYCNFETLPPPPGPILKRHVHTEPPPAAAAPAARQPAARRAGEVNLGVSSILGV